MQKSQFQKKIDDTTVRPKTVELLSDMCPQRVKFEPQGYVAQKCLMGSQFKSMSYLITLDAAYSIILHILLLV